jgi:CheY-like chemotaxis protein
MRKLRVNIVDDDVNNLKILRLIMTQRDYEVSTFDRPVVCPIYDAQQDQCIKPCADIIITDYQMPQMTGIEMLLQQAQMGCKVDRRNKILMSADTYNIKEKIIEELGCAFFSKPIKFGDFFAWLDDCEKRIDLSKQVGIIGKEDRYPVNIDILYAYIISEKIYKGIAMNYSAGGLCIKANAPLIEGQSIVIKNELPNGCKNVSVRWANPMEAGFYMAGLMAQ